MPYRANDPYYIRAYKSKERMSEKRFRNSQSLNQDNARQMRDLIESIDHLVEEIEKEK